VKQKMTEAKTSMILGLYMGTSEDSKVLAMENGCHASTAKRTLLFLVVD